MWTDGSTNSHTNFAADSGLEAEHCCIKVSRRMMMMRMKMKMKMIIQTLRRSDVDLMMNRIYRQNVDPQAMTQ